MAKKKWVDPIPPGRKLITFRFRTHYARGLQGDSTAALVLCVLSEIQNHLFGSGNPSMIRVPFIRIMWMLSISRLRLTNALNSLKSHEAIHLEKRPPNNAFHFLVDEQWLNREALLELQTEKPWPRLEEIAEEVRP